MTMELTKDGFQKIEEAIGDLQGKATEGISDPAKAEHTLREVRGGLFDLKNLIRTVVILDPKKEGR